jgi:hypothetical protein
MAALIIPIAVGVGGLLLASALAPKPKNTYGPRVSDLNVGLVSPGNSIIQHWGTMKLTCQLIWTSRLIETQHEVQQPSKGSLGGGQPKQYYYTYAVDCAFAVCRGPVYRVNRIWANQKLLWIHPDVQANEQAAFDAAYYAELDRLVNQEYDTDIDEAYCGAFVFAFNNYNPDEYTFSTAAAGASYIQSHPGVAPYCNPPVPPANIGDCEALLTQMFDGLGHDQTYAQNKLRFDSANIYLGSEEQIPNAMLESYLGAGNVPAFRGTVYICLTNLQLEDFGNAIPQFTVEVQQNKNGSAYLHDIIHDICIDSGLTEDEIDSLGNIPETIQIPGFAITQSMSGRQALNMLQSVFPFDAAESSYGIVFNWINLRPKAILRREDFGSYLEGDAQSSPPPSVETTRAMDLDLPKRINLKFQEVARNYSSNTVYFLRTATNSQSIDNIDVTIALTRDQAQKQVEELLALKYTASKSHKVYLPPKYVIIEPGDAVLVPDPSYLNETDQYFVWRCVEVNLSPRGLIEMTFVDHDQYVESGAIVEADLEDNTVTLPQNSPTIPYLLDIPLLDDLTSDTPGFYSVLGGNNDNWRGGALLVDISSGGTVPAFGQQQPATTTGSNWNQLAMNSLNMAHGYCMTALGPAHPACWDYKSKVRVLLRSKGMQLSNVAQSDLIANPFNVAIIGNEIVQYANVRALGNDIWELSTFLRGLRGTDYAINSHTRGERFVRLLQSSTVRITNDVRQLNKPGTFRAISSGNSLDSDSSVTFANTGNSLRPYAPAIYEQTRRSTGDVYIRWSPRVRQNGGLIDGQATVLDQPTEAYSIDVLDANGNVKNTYSFGAVREWTYTASAQATDYGSTPDKVYMNLYQIGQTIGRGFPATIEV